MSVSECSSVKHLICKPPFVIVGSHIGNIDMGFNISFNMMPAIHRFFDG